MLRFIFCAMLLSLSAIGFAECEKDYGRYTQIEVTGKGTYIGGNFESDIGGKAYTEAERVAIENCIKQGAEECKIIRMSGSCRESAVWNSYRIRTSCVAKAWGYKPKKLKRGEINLEDLCE